MPVAEVETGRTGAEERVAVKAARESEGLRERTMLSPAGRELR